MKKAIFLLSLLAWAGCSWITPREEGFSVLSWNVHNIFDDVADGGEPPEFDPTQGSWNRTLFLERLERTAQVIREAAGGLPDVVALQEVENLNTARTLSNRFLNRENYLVVGFDDPRLRIIPVFLTRHPPMRVSRIELPDYRGELQRPILEMELAWEDRTLVIWNNHWKSQRDGTTSTRQARVAAQDRLNQRAEWLRARCPQAILIAVGDFNSELRDEGLLTEWVTTESAKGTYFFRGVWTTLDHALVFPPLTFKTKFEVCVLPRLLTTNGAPRGYSVRDRGGYSDHLPIVLRLAIPAALGYTESNGMERFGGLPRDLDVMVTTSRGF